jgi:hypothetical protein
MGERDGIIDELEDFHTIAPLDGSRVNLKAHGYVPVLRWTKRNVGNIVTCTTGEAEANIRIAERLRKGSGHGR